MKKNLFVYLIMFCIMVSSMCSASIPVEAATLIKNITLSGDITPMVGEKLSFATADTNSDYLVVQMWRENKTERSFTDNEALNQTIDEEQLLPESERYFQKGSTYTYTIGLMPTGEGVAFDLNLTVCVGSYSDFIIEKNNESSPMYSILFYQEGEHLHISKAAYKTDEVYHWIGCQANDSFVFLDTKNEHDVTAENGLCKKCNYSVPDNVITKVILQPNDQSITCGDTVELFVGATGSNLKYLWYDSKVI